MANEMIGMTIAQIQGLARAMDQRARQLEALLGQLTTAVREVPWAGDDRDRFVGEWDERHAQHLGEVVGGLRVAARQARDHAAEQERVSRAQG